VKALGFALRAPWRGPRSPTFATQPPRRGLALAVLVIGGCAHSAATPVAPPVNDAAIVRDEIAQAETAEKARQHEVARAHYQAAVAHAHDPKSVHLARREFADTLMSWGELPEAIAQLEGAVAAEPDDAAAWHDLGILRHQQGDDPGAIAALEHARTLRASDPRPRIALAALRWKRGDRDGARKEYEALLQLDLPEATRAKVKWAIDELGKAP
jgi:Flp pilus assembly protein TadD